MSTQAVNNRSNNSDIVKPSNVVPSSINEEAIRVLDKEHGNLIISKNDTRKYKYFQLENGMKVVLVSDMATETAAAAVNVNVGHFADPENVPGLAHYLEHMLFLGSEKYPADNDWTTYINDNSGFSNAYTACNRTNYYFEVNATALEKSLDIFSGFFACPLFDMDGANREVQAVHSEHTKNLNSDVFRMFQLRKSTSNPDHPFHKFGTGSLATLKEGPAAEGIDLQTSLRKFHQQHYLARNMTLSVIGREDLTVLEDWCRRFFGPIPNERPSPAGSPLPDSNSSKKIPENPFTNYTALEHLYVPIQNTRQLSIQWGFPEQMSAFRAAPARLLSTVLGHESPGSLYYHLSRVGLCSELSCGLYMDEPGFSVFSLDINLTEPGLERVRFVLALVFAYIGVISAQPMEHLKRIFDESQDVKASAFRFAPREKPASYASELAERLLHYPPEYAVSADALLWEFDPDSAEKLLALLTPENARIMISSQDACIADQCDRREKWYNTPYAERRLSSEELTSLKRMTEASAKHCQRLLESGKRKGSITSEEPYLHWGHLRAAKIPLTARAAIDNKNDVGEYEMDASAGAGDSKKLEIDKWSPPASEEDVQRLLDALAPPLCLPEPNEFIATDFSLCNPIFKKDEPTPFDKYLPPNVSSINEYPSPPVPKVSHTTFFRTQKGEIVEKESSNTSGEENVPFLELFVSPDAFYGQPKAQVYVLLQMPSATTSIRAMKLNAAFRALINHQMKDFSYAAELASFHFSLNTHHQGLEVVITGFSHRMAAFCSRFFAAIASVVRDVRDGVIGELEADSQLYVVRRAAKNMFVRQPYDFSMQELKALVHSFQSCFSHELELVEGLRPLELLEFAKNALNGLRMRMAVCGNVTPEDAKALARAAMDGVCSSGSTGSPDYFDTMLPSILELPQSVKTGDVSLSFEVMYERNAANPNDPNAAVVQWLPLGPTSIDEISEFVAFSALLKNLLSEPYFHQLRTVQQLGYIVALFEGPALGECALQVIAQSDKVDGADLLIRVDNFFVEFRKTLDTMEASKLAATALAVATKELEIPQNPEDLAAKIWTSIRSGRMDLDKNALLLKGLQKIMSGSGNEPLERLKTFYDTYIAPAGAGRRCLTYVMKRGRVVERETAKSDELSKEESDNKQNNAAGGNAKEKELEFSTKKYGGVEVHIPLNKAAGLLLRSKSSFFSSFSALFHGVLPEESINNIHEQLQHAEKKVVRVIIDIPAGHKGISLLKQSLPIAPSYDAIGWSLFNAPH